MNPSPTLYSKKIRVYHQSFILISTLYLCSQTARILYLHCLKNNCYLNIFSNNSFGTLGSYKKPKHLLSTPQFPNNSNNCAIIFFSFLLFFIIRYLQNAHPHNLVVFFSYNAKSFLLIKLFLILLLFTSIPLPANHSPFLNIFILQYIFSIFFKLYYHQLLQYSHKS